MRPLTLPTTRSLSRCGDLAAEPCPRALPALTADICVRKATRMARTSRFTQHLLLVRRSPDGAGLATDTAAVARYR